MLTTFAKDEKYYQDHPVPKVLNATNYDIFVLGNHEFNFGMKPLDDILKDIETQKITANFYYVKDGKGYLEPTAIIEKDDVKLGIIGLTAPMSAKFEESTGMRDVINAVDGIDVVIAGHIHKNVPSETIKNTLITEPHRYGTVVSKVNLTFDVNNKKEVKLLKK